MAGRSSVADGVLARLSAAGGATWRRDACGVTRSGAAVTVLLHPAAFDADSPSVRVLLVGGVGGQTDDPDLTARAAGRLTGAASTVGADVALSVIPVACTGAPEAGRHAGCQYPPEGGYFDHPECPEARYLWRWISFAAPDLVLEVVSGNPAGWQANDAGKSLGAVLGAGSMPPDGSLLSALGAGAPSDLAPIPGLRLTVSGGSLDAEMDRLVEVLAGGVERSPARRVLDARRGRPPMTIARLLGGTYGHVLDPVIYTQGVAVSGRLRLAELEGDPDTAADVALLVERFASGVSPVFGDAPGGQHLAGLAWCDELSAATGDPRYIAMLLDAAGRYHAAAPGVPPPPCDDDFRTEDMFFTSAVLGRAYAVSGNARYIDIAARFLADSDTQKPDGLFMHCRGADWNWGRSNGFAAMGFAEALTYMSTGHALRRTLADRHVRHLEAMLPLQQPGGAWLQVLDYPGSYKEMSVTCMVGYALARGLRMGWLDNSFRGALGRAWSAAAERVDDAGGLVDVCTGTGVQSSTRDYLDRPAEFGFDHRGGSMALWFAVEVERLRRSDAAAGAALL